MTSKASTLPMRGQELPEIRGAASDGRTIHTSDLHGRKNIVAIFPGEQSSDSIRELIRALSDRHDEIHDEEAEVIVAEDTELHRAAICIADRYGEVYFSAFFSDTVPSADSVLEWLRFIEIQCPECGVSEWPSAA
jgi:hypothetical protein